MSEGMKRCLKKIIGIMSCLVLVCVSLSVLKKDNVIVWATPLYISERTEQLINSTLNRNGYDVKVEFELFEPENYYTEIRKEIIDGNVDIVFCGLSNWNEVGNRYELNDLLVNLEEYLDDGIGTKLYNSYPKRMWDSITIDGEIYWVCSGGNIPTKRAILVDGTMRRQYSLENDDICYENVCDIALASLVKEENYVIQNPALLLTTIPNVSFVCSPLVPLVIYENNSDLRVVNLWEDSTFVSMYNRIKEINSLGGIDWDRTEKDTLFQVVYYTTEEDCLCMGMDTDNMILLEESYYNPLETIGTYVGIAETTEKKDLVFEILAEIYTSSEYSDIFAYGEKGVDYEVVDGHVVEKRTHEYLNPNTVAGNIFLMTPTLYQEKNRIEDYYKELEMLESSKLKGFVFDGRNVKEEIREVTDLVANFYIEVANNPDILNQEMEYWQSLLREAGIEKIELEIERQLKDWKGAQNIETE